eukprot:Phypoly_transcript_14105.p1 GENE.Phypoly_transcript_14105~~Phypoly_transcript_14105.p1  ORF type:complete len:131 (+),score=16.44 Phypoly_transcript_14105:601-993(+)
MEELVAETDENVCASMGIKELTTRIQNWANVLPLLHFELLSGTEDFTDLNFVVNMYVMGLPDVLYSIQDCLGVPALDDNPDATILKQYAADFYTAHFTPSYDPDTDHVVLDRMLAFKIETKLPDLASVFF